MHYLNKSVQSFLENLETKLNCEIQFVPRQAKQPSFLTKDSLFYEEGKMGIPFFLKEEFYGCFFISSHDLTKEGFKLLEILIKEGFSYFLEEFGSYFYSKYLLQKQHEIEETNVISFSKEKDAVWNHLTKEPNILFVSGESREKILHLALNIHNLTPHLVFIHLDQVMKKEASFTDWSDFTFTTFFLPDWAACEDWQKQQIKDFISSSKSPLPLKIIIGLKEEDTAWKIS